MKLDGHEQITRQAVKEFVEEYRRGVGSQLKRTIHDPHGGSITYGPEQAAVDRDIIDVLTLGHWSNFAQKHHFMRRFDGQSPYQAYEEACQWILTNSVKFAKAAAAGRGAYHLAPLGYAIHCLEDSFAFGHCDREPATSDTQPGAISHVKLYAGKEKKDHSHHDKTWKNESTGKLSSVKDPKHKKKDQNYGILAKNAVKALLKTIFDTVLSHRGGELTTLANWQGFRNYWLAAAPTLGKEREKAYDFIDTRYNGFVWGDTNTALNFDESGLARDIYQKLKTNTDEIYNVFHRLNEYHTADADDVAEIYVNKLIDDTEEGEISKAVGRNAKLCALLIQVMDEGWTTDGEYECIAFVKKLRKAAH